MTKNTQGGLSSSTTSKPDSQSTEQGVRGTFGAVPIRPVGIKKGKTK